MLRWTLLTLLLLGAVPPPPVALENERVRVLAPRIAPGEGRPTHEHPPRVVIALQDALVEQTLPDGSVAELRLAAGSVRFSPAIRHAVRNAGTAALELVEVELKPGAPASAAPVADPAEDPAHLTLELDNELVRVLRFRLGPHERSSHRHGEHVTVALADGHYRATPAGGAPEEQRRPRGSVRYGAALAHVVENLEDRPFEAILIELKGPPPAPAR